jgi:transcriptional regulator with XRE-family HTH domain
VLPFRTRPQPEPKLRNVIGAVLRDERRVQSRTLADVASEAAVSLPYLSEIERGRKEVSSDVLSAVCDALDLPLVEVFVRSARRLGTRPQGGSGIQLRAA